MNTMKKILTVFALSISAASLMSCEKSYVCECEVDYQNGKSGYEYYPMEGSRRSVDRNCWKGRVADNVKYDRGDCQLVD